MADSEKKHMANVKWLAMQLIDLMPEMTGVRAMEISQKLIYRYAKREAEKGENDADS